MSVLLRLLAAVLVLGTLAVSWWVIGAVAPGVPETVAPPSTDDLRPDPSLPRPGPDWPTLLVIGAVLAAVAVVARLRAVRGGLDGDGSDGERGQGDTGPGQDAWCRSVLRWHHIASLLPPADDLAPLRATVLH